MPEASSLAPHGPLATVLEIRRGPDDAHTGGLEHREALIYALGKAAELEHLVMLQYLFAALSLKQYLDEGLTPESLGAVQRWRNTLLEISHQEMLHLALVQNLLTAIGAAPRLTRPNFPMPAYAYPAGVRIELVPFGEAALRHFAFLERPESRLFRGPYLRVRTPFREALPGWEKSLDWYPDDFRPYTHQATAWQRLSSKSGHAPEPTIVTTGTGSGKTESFLIPILDHCARARAAGVKGIKALLLYPMNALANAQYEDLVEILSGVDDGQLVATRTRVGVRVPAGRGATPAG